MKTVLLISLVLALGATMAFAQGGSIGLFADYSGTDCDLAVPPSSVVQIHIVWVHGAVGGCAWEVRAVPPPCFNAMFLNVMGPFPESFMGSLEYGWTVLFGGGVHGPVALGTMLFFMTGPTPPCCAYTVTARVDGNLGVWDCEDQFHPSTPGTLILNPTEECTCDVPVRDTSWGAIKALYVE